MTEDQRLIEDYLVGNLSSAEKKSLEARCQKDDDFRQQFLEEQLIFNSIKDHHAQVFLTNTRNILNSNSVRNPRARNLTLKLMAASVIVLLGIFLIWKPTSSKSPQQLYTDFFRPYPMVLSQRGDAEGTERLVQAYEQNNWIVVEQELGNLDPDLIPSPLLDLYWTISLLQQDKTDKAIRLLEKYRKQPVNDLYQQTLEWYLAMAYLQMGNSSDAKSVLTELARKTKSSQLQTDIGNILKQL
ncbi:MAG: hypothetical protein KDC53_18510 [Saprospiraceae bacterium]|nr:hypothetical protein [Saprospiraceae bacterium]